MYKSFVSPLKIICGEGSIKEVPSIVKSQSAKRIMIFADQGIINAGITDILTNLLVKENLEYQIYSDLIPEPPIDIANKALDALKEYNPDVVIGIGGGSTIDIAKAIAVLSENEGSVEDYLNLTEKKEIGNKGLYKILIPTTSGTGAEVTDIAVFSLEDTKDVITHEHLLADVAIIDPKLTYTLSPRITAATGVDALTHAIESYVSINATPLTDALALEAISKISSSIRTAVWNGKDRNARSNMSWGSMLAGQSFYNAGVAGVHALAYPLGGLFKIPHGEANSVLLPYIFDYIWPSCMDKMKTIAGAMGLHTEHLTNREASIEVVKELQNIVNDVGLFSNLKEYGVKESDIEILAKNGIRQTRLLARSPKSFDINDVRECYKAAYNGTLKLGG